MPESDKHQRTEKPTPKKRHDARERGQVARSPDISAFAGLLAGSMLLPTIISSAKGHVLSVFAQALRVVQNPTTAGALQVFVSGMVAVLETVLPLAAALAALGCMLNLGQVGLHLSGKALAPKFSRISPKAGFKRLFSASTGVSLAKQLAKLTLLGSLTVSVMSGLLHAVPVFAPISLASTIGIGGNRILTFVRSVALLGVAVGLGDFLYQRKHLLDTLKMTKQEVKDEAKQRNGDPAMRNEVLRRGYQIARSHTLAAVRSADVVIANPNHFAVAIRYDRTSSAAPVVVAKGEGSFALRIKEEAARCSIPVVEDPPLARYLYATTDAGRQVPAEIYLAVARLLAFIYSLPATFRGGSIHTYPHSHVPFDPGAADPAIDGALVAPLTTGAAL